MNESISVPEIPNIVNAPLSLGVKNGRLVSVCGMAPISPDGVLVGIGDVEVQAEQVLKNMALILQKAGGKMSDVIKTTVFLANIEDYDKMNKVYARHFSKECYPARAAIGVKMGDPRLLIEIEALAVLPEDPASA